jgi:hypothetical protein
MLRQNTKPIIQAILLFIADMYEGANRGAVVSTAATMLCDRIKILIARRPSLVNCRRSKSSSLISH